MRARVIDLLYFRRFKGCGATELLKETIKIRKGPNPLLSGVLQDLLSPAEKDLHIPPLEKAGETRIDPETDPHLRIGMGDEGKEGHRKITHIPFGFGQKFDRPRGETEAKIRILGWTVKEEALPPFPVKMIHTRRMAEDHEALSTLRDRLCRIHPYRVL
jgi:hypothetical protein